MERRIRRVRATVAAATAATVALTLVACGGSAAATSATQQTSGQQSNGGAPNAAGLRSMLAGRLDALVQKGTINKTQETAVLDAFAKAMTQGPQGGAGQPQGAPPRGQAPQGTPSPGATPRGAPQGGPPTAGGMFSEILDSFVTKGTITKAQETAIINAIRTGMPSPGQAAPTPTASLSAQSL